MQRSPTDFGTVYLVIIIQSPDLAITRSQTCMRDASQKTGNTNEDGKADDHFVTRETKLGSPLKCTLVKFAQLILTH